MEMRLRQIALVARDLDAVRADIASVFGLDYAYVDPVVGRYGLTNLVFPVGDTFLEVVSPVVEGTTAGRLLEKRRGDGGYMVILQTDHLAQARDRGVVRQCVTCGVVRAKGGDGAVVDDDERVRLMADCPFLADEKRITRERQGGTTKRRDGSVPARHRTQMNTIVARKSMNSRILATQVRRAIRSVVAL